MRQAIAPFVAKARAAYPAAKKRFVAGSIPKEFFSVWLLFVEVDPRTKNYEGEYLFVVVNSIKNGVITGRVNNQVVALKNHRYGQRVRVDGSSVENWSIYHQDSPEERNYGGKFLDRWQSPGRRAQLGR